MQAFHGHCENCDFVSAETVGGVPALILDAPSDDSGADPTDPRLIRLLDSRSRETIARSGYSFIGATLNGRYLRINDVFCTECGRLYEIRSLAPAFAQFGLRLWFVAAIPFAILFFAISPSMVTGILNGLFFGFIAGGATVALIDSLLGVYLRAISFTRTRIQHPACLSRLRLQIKSQSRYSCPDSQVGSWSQLSSVSQLQNGYNVNRRGETSKRGIASACTVVAGRAENEINVVGGNPVMRVVMRLVNCCQQPNTTTNIPQS